MSQVLLIINECSAPLGGGRGDRSLQDIASALRAGLAATNGVALAGDGGLIKRGFREGRDAVADTNMR